MNDQLELRPVREDDLPLLEKFTFDRDAKGEFQWFGWSDLRQWRQGWDENGLIGPDGGTLLVVLGDERLGAVVWHRRPAGPAAHSWELGIAMFPASRGRGYGTQAHRLITAYLSPISRSIRPWRRPGSPGKAWRGAWPGATAPGGTG